MLVRYMGLTIGCSVLVRDIGINHRKLGVSERDGINLRKLGVSERDGD